ncbi:hypothetical protein BJ742DRAFT_849875 [Cladochytrium replicatum]|nr:hypothetical protein BJ742DRAFT_849875 [Cladochytrium replicatum]
MHSVINSTRRTANLARSAVPNAQSAARTLFRHNHNSSQAQLASPTHQLKSKRITQQSSRMSPAKPAQSASSVLEVLEDYHNRSRLNLNGHATIPTATSGRDILLIPPTVPSQPFVLDPDFLDTYATRPAPFGFNGLGEIVYRRTYSRVIPHLDRNEHWHETVGRVVTGCFNMQRIWCDSHGMPFDHVRAQAEAQEMYSRIFDMKFLPPGRGLWAMGSPITEERRLYAALNNCAFVSTEGMWEKGPGNSPAQAFAFLMDMSMLGVGVGFDTKGARDVQESTKTFSSTVHLPDQSLQPVVYVIPDTREGWVQGTTILIESYLLPGRAPVILDYGQVRPAGLPIRGFGGVASGPAPLMELHEELRRVLGANSGSPMSVRTLVDVFNLLGKCVVSGNVRRTAEIAFGDPKDADYIDLKNYEVNPERAAWGWTSNNSVVCEVGMDYRDVTQRVKLNGEPGFFWLDSARRYGRMCDPPNDADIRAKGGNPCLEQTLESYELCTLVETFPHNHETLEDFLDTLESAYLYAKTVTLGATHWPESNMVMSRNRRIGCSMSGIAQFVETRGVGELRRWSNEGFKRVREIDERVSERFGIAKSVKVTSIKPSGTVSILAGATPGMHYPESRYCIRRVRLSATSPLVAHLQAANYHVEPAITSPETTVVASFPIDFGPMRSLSQVSMYEQLCLARELQAYWADNQVSCTVTFDPKTEDPGMALSYFDVGLKGVSFLPRMEGVWEQMPYEGVSEEVYRAMVENVDRDKLARGLMGEDVGEEPEIEKGCETDVCSLGVKDS